MFLKSVTPRHVVSQTCRAQAARIQEHEKIASLAQLARNVKFFVNGEPLETVTKFKYLGRILSADDSDDGAVNMNITKATKTWFRMHRVLSRDTADHCVMGHFYLAVVQAQLLYGSETWVISKRTVKRLESFHNRCARTIAHRPIRRLPHGTWEYPPTEEVLNICGLSDISTYIARCKTSLLNRYAKPESQIYNLCKHSTPIGSSAHRQMWWT
jgi:hypothetical protein